MVTVSVEPSRSRRAAACGPVVDRPGGLDHPLPRRGGHVRIAVERARDRRDRQAERSRPACAGSSRKPRPRRFQNVLVTHYTRYIPAPCQARFVRIPLPRLRSALNQLGDLARIEPRVRCRSRLTDGKLQSRPVRLRSPASRHAISRDRHAHHRHCRHHRSDQLLDRQRLYRLLQDDRERGRDLHRRQRGRQAGRRLRLQFERPLRAARAAARALHPAPKAAKPEAIQVQRGAHRPGQGLGRDDDGTRSPAGTASARSRSACSTWRCGTRSPRPRACRSGGFWPTAIVGARPMTPPGSMPPAATTIPARASTA